MRLTTEDIQILVALYFLLENTDTLTCASIGRIQELANAGWIAKARHWIQHNSPMDHSNVDELVLANLQVQKLEMKVAALSKTEPAMKQIKRAGARTKKNALGLAKHSGRLVAGLEYLELMRVVQETVDFSISHGHVGLLQDESKKLMQESDNILSRFISDAPRLPTLFRDWAGAFKDHIEGTTRYQLRVLILLNSFGDESAEILVLTLLKCRIEMLMGIAQKVADYLFTSSNGTLPHDPGALLANELCKICATFPQFSCQYVCLILESIHSLLLIQNKSLTTSICAGHLINTIHSILPVISSASTALKDIIVQVACAPSDASQIVRCALDDTLKTILRCCRTSLPPT